MKQLLLLLLCLISVTTFAQRFRWAQGASGTGIVYYRSATDKHGNVYVTGYYQGTANFSGTSITSAGSQDIFLAKYDTTGALLWVSSAGSIGYDIGYSCAVDSADNCYVVGTFSGTCTFSNGKAAYSFGSTDAFVAKYNKNGLCQWVNRFGSATAEQAYGVDCTPNGTVFVTGYFTGLCYFLSQTFPLSNRTLTATGSYNIFLAKYFNNGVIDWVRSGGGGGYNYGFDVTVDDSANAYIVGWYQGSASFYDDQYNTPVFSISLNNSSSSWYNGFIVKYDKNGHPKWAQNCPSGCQYGYAYAIAGDGYGNIFVTGYYYGTATFGSFTLTSPSSGYGSFIAKLNTNGVFEWVNNIISSGNSFAWGYDVAANASGACFVTGYEYGWGARSWICNTPFPSYNATSGSYYHCYGVKYKSNGDCGWSIRGTSDKNSGYAYGYGVSVNDFGSVYISGFNTNDLKFYLNGDTVTSYGNVSGSTWGSFLSHWEDDNFIVIDRTKLSLCPGDSFYLPFHAYGVYADSNIYRAQLSDGNGGFQSFQYVGQKTTTSSLDSILVHIPVNLPNGLGYRFRVEASAPLTRSNKSLNDMAIVRPVADILTPDDTICLGDSVQLNCANAFKYKWYSNFYIKDSTISNPYISPPASTTIHLRTLNQAGCENFDSMKITILPRPIPDAGRDTSVCIGDSLQLNATGGTIYRWYPKIGLSDSTIANPKVLLDASRTYHVIVGNGYCVEEDSLNLTMRSPLKILNYADTTICKGQSAMLHVTPSGGYSPGYALAWDNGMGSGNYFLVSPPITTTYRAIISDGCTKLKDTAFITVNVRPKLLVTPRTDTTICKGQSVSLYAFGTGGFAPNYIYTWNNNAGIGKQVTVSPLVTTTYRVLLKDLCTLLSDSGFVTVFVRGDLVVHASNDTDICIGQSATMRVLNTTGGDLSNYSYQWFDPNNNLISTVSTCNVSPVVTSDYYVVVKDNCTSKSDTDFVTINVRPKLHVTAMADTIICKGSTVRLNIINATGGFVPTHAFTWYDAAFNSIGTGPQITSPVINTPTKFYVVMRDNCTSLNDTDDVVISNRPPLKIVARIDSIICIGQAVKLYGQASGGDSLHYSYKWMDSTTNAFIGYGNYFVTTPLATTTYKVILSDNCTPKTDSDYVKIIHRTALVIIFPKDTTICLGNSVNLFVDGSGGDSTSYEFKWNNGLGSGKSTVVTPLITYTYKVVLTDYCTLKSDSATIKVTVRDALKINAGVDQTICYGQSTTLDPTIISGGLPANYTYQWYDVTNNISLGTTKSINVAPTSNTLYRVVFSDNCTVLKDSDEIRVSVHPALQIKIISPSVSICRGQKVALQAMGSGYNAALLQYQWSNNLGTKSSINFYPDSTHYYKVTLSDGCSLPVSDSVLINVEQLPQPDFSVIDSAGCNPFTVQFTDQSTNNTNCRYLWYFGDGTQDTTNTPSHTYTKANKYTVELTLTSPTGCSNTISKINFIVNNVTPLAKFSAAPVKVKISNGVIYFTSKSQFADSLQMQFGDGQQMDWTADKQWLHKYTDTGIFIVQLTVKNNFNCTASVSDTIVVEEDFNYFMPNAFSPNKDGLNEIIRPSITFVKRYEFKVYNRWGTLLYDSSPLNCDAKQQCGWDGNYKSEKAPEGIYIYQMYILDKADKEHFDRGTFMLVR
jgi:gliding motility-associated-like protein